MTVEGLRAHMAARSGVEAMPCETFAQAVAKAAAFMRLADADRCGFDAKEELTTAGVFLYAGAVEDPRFAALLIDGARREPVLYDTVCTLTAGLLRQGAALPAALAGFAADVLQGIEPRPKAPKQSRKLSTWRRDLILCQAVALLERSGWRPIWWSEASPKEESALHAVGRAAGDVFGAPLRYDTMKEIWGRSRQHPAD